jgi:hypothetical protein
VGQAVELFKWPIFRYRNLEMQVYLTFLALAMSIVQLSGGFIKEWRGQGGGGCSLQLAAL